MTTDKAHGRVETRRIWVSDKLNGYVTFPYAAQVACVEREIFHVRKQDDPRAGLSDWQPKPH
ncbi:hypothetical protein C4901_03470 [Acidiferrobacter sp. SPIII_3]|nr:hypothetical protein C4901_03470 [Acidiferrobacter sp. SPIII_3]